jgi:glycosyltransferase 2 family protein
VKKNISIIISTIITIVLLYYLLSKIEFSDVINILKNSSVPLLMLGFLLYFVSLCVRALRFKILLNSSNKMKMHLLFPITLFYNFANTVVPMRLGEFSYVYLLKKTKRIPAAIGLSTLIISRMFDFISIIFALFLAVFLAKKIPAGLLPFMPAVLLFLLGLILLTVLFIFWQEPIIYIFNRTHDFFIRKQASFIKRKFLEFVDAFRKMQSKKTLALSLALSLIINFLIMEYGIILAKGMGFSYSVNVMIAVMCLSLLSSVIPISGINGFGTTETVWGIIMVAFGYTLNEGVILSLSLHIIQTVFMLFLGFIGWLGVRKLTIPVSIN